MADLIVPGRGELKRGQQFFLPQHRPVIGADGKPTGEMGMMQVILPLPTNELEYQNDTIAKLLMEIYRELVDARVAREGTSNGPNTAR